MPTLRHGTQNTLIQYVVRAQEVGSERMDKNKALELLKQALDEIPKIRTLTPDRQQYQLWRGKICNILELAFGEGSREYDNFSRAVRADYLVYNENEKRGKYNKELDAYETALKSAIHKCELFEAEEKLSKTLKPYENLGGRIVGNEFEVALLGTVDMTIECMMHFTKKLNSQGHAYKSSPRIGGHPDYAKPDRTCYATVTISEITESKEKQVGTIQLHLIPEEKTLFKTSHPEEWDSSFKYFLETLFTEFEESGFMRKEKKAPAEDLLPETITAKAGWKDIENKYDMTKNRFGRKINFVTDSFKRKIIFRDVKDACELASLGYAKPAVLLAGGVIEELLRLYLAHKGFSPPHNTLDSYIKTCEQNGLFRTGVAPLSDSLRQFRNLVHLSREKASKYSITKATAIGAVSSIFTIANDF